MSELFLSLRKIVLAFRWLFSLNVLKPYRRNPHYIVLRKLFFRFRAAEKIISRG